MVSMQTLLKAHGYYQCRYAEIMGVLRQYSSDPARDLELLFRQMVFNGVVANTDDHLKNFWMLYGRGEGWRLSPSFDLLPDINQRGEHILFFDTGGYYPGRQKIIALGRIWGLSNAVEIVDQVYEAVSSWRGEFASLGIPAGDIERFKEIEDNLMQV
jgi:serine/threonine-protein kinase HipA